jgi:hypothetical protein
MSVKWVVDDAHLLGGRAPRLQQRVRHRHQPASLALRGSAGSIEHNQGRGPS